MEINVHHCLIKNGKRYDKIAIDETVTEDKLPELWTKYRKKIGSIKKKDSRGRNIYTPDILFCWMELK